MVPLLLVALFVDSSDERRRRTPRRSRWEQVQDRSYALLAVSAFFTSSVVASDVIRPSHLTTALVITALAGTMTRW